MCNNIVKNIMNNMDTYNHIFANIIQYNFTHIIAPIITLLYNHNKINKKQLFSRKGFFSITYFVSSFHILLFKNKFNLFEKQKMRALSMLVDFVT